MIRKTYVCPRCSSSNLRKNGMDAKGRQKYHCKDCARYGQLEKAPRYPEERKTEILRAYRERSSLRGLERIFGVARQTVALWLKEEFANLPSNESTPVEAEPNDELELDEMWSFVQCLDNKRWIWIALCKRTRQVVAWVVGDRSEEACRRLWMEIPETYKHCCRYSDFRKAYQAVIPDEQHRAVGKETGLTNHLERFNNVIRQRLACFVGKTLSFSKSEWWHYHILKWFIIEYNLSVVI